MTKMGLQSMKPIEQNERTEGAETVKERNADGKKNRRKLFSIATKRALISPASLRNLSGLG
jgi:hypothetical protein